MGAEASGGGVKRGWRWDRADRELVTVAHGVDAFGASFVDENVARARFTVMKKRSGLLGHADSARYAAGRKHA